MERMIRLLFFNLGAAALGPTIRAHPSLWALQRIAEQHLGQFQENSSLLVALGAVPEARELVTKAEVERLAPDAFLLRSRNVAQQTVVACAGRSARAVGYAFFELLQLLGFGFLHPLLPVVPSALPELRVEVHETPRWEFRGTHYHTQHPLELTNLLNGYDGSGQTDCRQCWAKGLKAWQDYLDWMMAQKQNYIEWMLLADRHSSKATHHQRWRFPQTNFELSDERRERLRILVAAAHARGIEVGVDVPLSLKQQHALNLLPSPGRQSHNEEQVRARVRWLRSCGFDHLGTELGTTEFTRGLHAAEMVRLLNITQEELGPQKVLVKNHCSTNQYADGFTDPRPSHSGVLNFNYLNYFADPKIVSMPHTVQAYSLSDPAPTYGNADFSDLRNWTSFLLQQGRPVVFYPETAYWVNYDISVPLFLAPTYASDRVEDADSLDAMSGTVPLLGQLNFESGWQWGYWLANSAQALVAWRRESLQSAFLRLLRFMPQKPRVALAQLLVEFAAEQRRLLVKGLRRGGVQTPPAPGVGPGSATAMAYIQGSEGLSDFASLAARYLGEGAPQPDRVHFMELWREVPSSSLRLLQAIQGGSAVTDAFLGTDRLRWQRQSWFQEHLRPLLAETNATFAELARRFERIPAPGKAFQDLAVSARMLSLRCSQVLALYEYSAMCRGKETEFCQSRLTLSRSVLSAAQALAEERAEHMGLEALDRGTRVLEWSEPIPTAYSYGYLWAAHTLFYWRRDQEMVEQQIADVCFGAINDPVELGLAGGGGPWARWAQSVMQSALSNRLWHVELAKCLGPPTEPKLGAAKDMVML
ncbi:unnamed protein product [Effrenium voratum]|uniref:Alpha glucuronidase N-terminal domain-containing protein n=1 Tax=Effrenium voratum TaxID=2562239 RepID=A0AA36N4S7_9DINO|nr:unnamed protein product [Effrenium voratum]